MLFQMGGMSQEHSGTMSSVMKKGIQHSTNTPIKMPTISAAFFSFCSRHVSPSVWKVTVAWRTVNTIWGCWVSSFTWEIRENISYSTDSLINLSNLVSVRISNTISVTMQAKEKQLTEVRISWLLDKGQIIRCWTEEWNNRWISYPKLILSFHIHTHTQHGVWSRSCLNLHYFSAANFVAFHKHRAQLGKGKRECQPSSAD